MGEISFADNFNDISDETGFQFEFYCERCNDTWRCEYRRYIAGTASSILNTASGILGGVLGTADRVADHVKDAAYRSAHDKAFAAAIEDAKRHFHRCRQCGNYVCAKCYNPDIHLCTGCAPSIAEAADVAKREAELDRATFDGYREGWKKDHKLAQYVICPGCGAHVSPAKFCSECGAELGAKTVCVKCGAELPEGAKFCPGCGAKR